jgi:transcriptional regulator with XRE-family HTH domain
MFETIEIKTVKRELGFLVKALRKQRGLSQIQLAKSLDVSRTTIQNLELGKNFTVNTFLKVLKEMDLLSELNSEILQAKSHVINSKSMY